MPDGTNIRKFMRAVKEGKSDITRALDKIFKHPGSIPSDIKAALHQDWSLSQLSQRLREEIQDQDIDVVAGVSENLHVTNKELDHIDLWPNDKKEDIRKVLAIAVGALSGTPGPHAKGVEFSWQLTRDKTEEDHEIWPDWDSSSGTFVNPNLPNEPIRITFFTPWANVREEAANEGEVTVLVRPPK